MVRCSKAQAKEKGLTYAEALDEALCFGWIDGVRRRVDAESFSVRFSPRKPKSTWSAVNIRKAAALEAAGRMRPPGRAALAAREERSAKRYSYESKPHALEPAFERKLKRHSNAWEFFRSQARQAQRRSITPHTTREPELPLGSVF